MSSATLAIVDDDQPFAEYLQTMLRSRGYETLTDQSGDALLTGLREGALPDVILLDVSMPGLDGLETLRQIRLAHPAAQVVMLSGGQTPAPIVEAVLLAATDYVVQPGDPDGVGRSRSAAIRNALERLADHRSASGRARRSDRSGRRATALELRQGDAAGDDNGRVRPTRHQRCAASGVGKKRSRAILGARRAARRRSSRSIARHCRPNCSRANSEGMSAARSRRRVDRVGKFEFSTARLLTKSAMPQALRPRSFTCCRIASSRSLAATAPSKWTRASSPPPTAISSR